MLNSKSFLAADFGAGSLKLAEFEINEAGGLFLRDFAIQSLGADGAKESAREAVITKALTDVLAQKSFAAKSVNVCAPGFHVFSKLVKLPPVDTSKVTQIIQYEAQQNVPFPLEEVVWDYQILGALPSGELEVLLVAIKSDIVEGLFRVVESTGLRLQLADVSPAALCNAFRYNYGDLEDCSMLLDIGAKTSNLLFFEKGKFFARSINIGAGSITQDFAREAKLKFDEADQIKIAEGFVSLGGAYEEPENPHQAAISKIARQFMTRLHIQVNQTMQFYRGQQGGAAPARLYLSGGASIMPYTAQFFAEKLNVPVEYFNPFRNVQIDPAVDLEELSKVAHGMGEVVGLGLRNLAHCPVELNLLPATTLKWQTLNQKKPYLIATVFSLVLVVLASSLVFRGLANVKRDELGKVNEVIQPLKAKEASFRQAYSQLQETESRAEQIANLLKGRFYWADLFAELREALIRAEENTTRDLRTETGVWIERFISAKTGPQFGVPGMPGAPGSPYGAYGVDPSMAVEMDGYMSPEMQAEQQRVFSERYGGGPAQGGYGSVPGEYEVPYGAPQPQIDPISGQPIDPSAQQIDPMTGLPMDSGQQIDPMTGLPIPGTGAGGEEAGKTVTMLCRAVSLTSIDPSANPHIAFAVLNELRASPMIDAEGTQLSPNLDTDDTTGTFTFEVTLKLKDPPAEFNAQ